MQVGVFDCGHVNEGQAAVTVGSWTFCPYCQLNRPIQYLLKPQIIPTENIGIFEHNGKYGYCFYRDNKEQKHLYVSQITYADKYIALNTALSHKSKL